MTAPVGVLVMAYGTPRSPEDLEAYYTHIRRGRPPSRRQLDDLAARYAAIGGVSPLAARTEAQAAAIGAALERRAPGRFLLALGYKHAEPLLEEAVDALADAGVSRIVGLVLAPHYSSLSVGDYLQRARDRAADHGLELDGVESWHLDTTYLHFLTAAVRDRLAELPDQTKVLFTAHSLPSRVLAGGDPYPEQVRETAEAVAGRAGLRPWAGWAVCWQSAGRTPEPWLGPDVLHVVRDLAAHFRRAGWDGTPAQRGVLVCPCGFVAEHLEILFDLDVDARRVAEREGLVFARTAVPDDDPALMAALAGRVLDATAVTSGG